MIQLNAKWAKNEDGSHSLVIGPYVAIVAKRTGTPILIVEAEKSYYWTVRGPLSSNATLSGPAGGNAADLEQAQAAAQEAVKRRIEGMMKDLRE